MPRDRASNWTSLAVLAASVLVAIVLGVRRQLEKPPPKDPSHYEVEIPQRRTRVEAERAAIHRLMLMLERRPKASRYVVNYVYDGKHVGGVVPKVLSYNPRKRRIQDAFGTTGEASLRIENVGRAEVRRVAGSGGSLADLKRAAEPSEARKRFRPPALQPIRDKA